MLPLAVALWQGVEHTWHDKVHRVGRFGSWVDGGQVHHLARAGTATDTATWTTRYALVEATGSEGVVTVPVRAREGEVFSFDEELVLQGHLALLNGFALRVDEGGSSKKLGMLSLSVDGEPTDQGLRVQVSGELMMSCRSAECWGAGDAVEYALDVYVIALDAPVVTEGWTLSELAYDSRQRVAPPAPSEAPEGLLGLRGLRFQVAKQVRPLRPDPVPHLYGWSLWMQDGLYSAWFAHDKAHWSNVGHRGEARFALDAVLLDRPFRSCAWTHTASFGNERQGEEHVVAPVEACP